MLFYKFKNYDEFKSIFGIQHHSNVAKSRKNKILLAYIKNKELLHQAVKSDDYTLIHLSSITELKLEMKKRIKKSGLRSSKMKYKVNLNGETYYSAIYSTDDNNGLCEDGDFKAIRYINHENDGRVFKMKAGKFFRAIILETKFGRTLPEQVLIHLCEDFAMEWQGYCIGKLPKNKLYVNDDFHRIYSKSACEGDFHSCMAGTGYHSFYKKYVDASAAYLENEEGKIIARAVIFNKVKDENGKIWRLCERQYSTDCNDVLKRALVDALIRDNHIDGYKKIGAGCNDTRAFLDVNGNSLADKEFSIECTLGYDGVLSYQDSFKYLDIYNHVAFNHESADYDEELSITYGHLGDDDDDDDDDNHPDEYDSYHDRYVWETTTVYVNGRRESCDVDDLEDFFQIDGRWIHEDDVEECPICKKQFIRSEGTYSQLTEMSYCSDECESEGELDYKKEHWHYSDYDQEYVEKKDELSSFMEYSSITGEYNVKTILTTSLLKAIDNGEFKVVGGVIYDTVDSLTGHPYRLIKQLEEVA